MATSPSEPIGSDGIGIVKDPGFFRAIADTVFVIPKGAETELCFIAVGPDPVMQFNEIADPVNFNPGAVQLKASLSDIGHVRIDGKAAADLAISILGSLITREIVTLEEVMDNVALFAKNEPSATDQSSAPSDAIGDGAAS